jgi:anti-sigma regulatory factor (Ser/Thr protein kinase)
VPTDMPVPAAEPPTGTSLGEWSLPPEPRSARLARRLVTQAIEDGDDGVRRRAALVTSELVANGVRYARGGMVLTVHQLEKGWVVAVADDSPAPPLVRDVGQLAEAGRGLMIVERVSDTLGWARTPTGKVVWALLGRSDGD